MVFLFQTISKPSKDEAMVTAKIVGTVHSGGELYRFRVIREDGKWRAIEKKFLVGYS